MTVIMADHVVAIAQDMFTAMIDGEPGLLVDRFDVRREVSHHLAFGHDDLNRYVVRLVRDLLDQTLLENRTDRGYMEVA